MTQSLSAVFLTHASNVLAETTLGLTGPKIVEITVAYAVEWNVTIPHEAYPFGKSVPNKRRALYENLMAFSEKQRYKIIRDLCEDPTVVPGNRVEVEKLKLMLITRYGHLADEALGSEIDAELVERTEHWLGPYQNALSLYRNAVKNHANGLFLRNILDDLRLALELLTKGILINDKSLENQVPLVGAFIQTRGGSPEFVNMFVKLIDYYTKYQNSYVKHDDAVIEEEVEFIFELTSSFMKHFVRLAYKSSG